MDMDEDNQPHSELVSSFEPSHKCIIIDGMAVLHLIPNSTKMQTIFNLSRMFNAKIEDKMNHYDEIRLVFDPYTDESRKQATRAKRQKGAGTYYAVSASTNLAVIGMKEFLGLERTKQELTTYLADRFMQAYKDQKHIYTTSYTRNKGCSVTRTNVGTCVEEVASLQMNHDEADTMIIATAAHFTQQARPSDVLHVWSPDTDVLLLLIYHKTALVTNTFMFWQDKIFNITGLYSYLGPAKSACILGWHAMTGCDTTGRFAGRGKKSWWNIFLTLHDSDDEDIIQSFQDFGENSNLSCSTEAALARFVTLGYAKGTDSLPAARWFLFTKKLAQGDKLPPMPNAFRQHLLRALVQTLTWRHAHRPIVSMPDVKNDMFGWRWNGSECVPIPSTNTSAPSAIMELIKCNCHGACETRACTCFRGKMTCTEMCHVTGDNS